MSVQIIIGDCLEKLKTLPDQSVHCVVTSPPYWGLRSYQLNKWVGGDPTCEHEGKPIGGGETKNIPSSYERPSRQARPREPVCKHCGAIAQQVSGGVGLEATFDDHLANLMAIFDEVRRVLRDDGTLWLNYGDRYDDGDLMQMPAQVAIAMKQRGWRLRSEIVWHKPNPMPESTKHRPTCAHEKILLFCKGKKPQFWTHTEWPGVRQKPAPDIFYMNRKTREIRLWPPLRKNGKPKKNWKRRNKWAGHPYFYDIVATRTPIKQETIERYTRNAFALKRRGSDIDDQNLTSFTDKQRELIQESMLDGDVDQKTVALPPGLGDQGPNVVVLGAYKSDGVGRRSESGKLDGGHRSTRWPGIGKKHAGERDRNEKSTEMQVNEGANLRNVWTVTTTGFHGAHFATMPPDIVEPCIKAGTSEHGCCSECGAPYARQLSQATGGTIGESWHDHSDDLGKGQAVAKLAKGRNGENAYKPAQTIGWQKTCDCKTDETSPAVVLDPFGGAGTVSLCAERLNRDSILIEISPSYVKLAHGRILGDCPMFANVEITK